MLLHLEFKNTTSHTFNDICKHTTSAHEHESPMALTEVEQQESKVTPPKVLAMTNTMALRGST